MPKDHRVFLIRHGETEFNRVGRFQGQKDSPLTEKGIEQAQRHGRVLSDLVDDLDDWRIVASPLGRTLHTARLICFELGLDARKIEPDDRLMEVRFGQWEGLDRDEIEARWPGVWTERYTDHWNHIMPEGESIAMVAARAEAWLAEVDSPLIVVSHGMTGRVIRGLYCGLDQGQTLAQDEPQDAFFELHQGKAKRH